MWQPRIEVRWYVVGWVAGIYAYGFAVGYVIGSRRRQPNSREA